eukprot:s159_g11.t1
MRKGWPKLPQSSARFFFSRRAHAFWLHQFSDRSAEKPEAVSAMGCSASQPQQRAPMPAFKMDIKSEGQLAGQHGFDTNTVQKHIDKQENEAIQQGAAAP